MKGYKVVVADNYHYMDESAHYVLGFFETADEALAAAKGIVDEFLNEAAPKVGSADELYRGYVGFGEDPFIVPIGKAPRVAFSAWGYAKERCEQLAGKAIAEPEGEKE